MENTLVTFKVLIQGRSGAAVVLDRLEHTLDLPGEAVVLDTQWIMEIVDQEKIPEPEEEAGYYDDEEQGEEPVQCVIKWQ